LISTEVTLEQSQQKNKDCEKEVGEDDDDDDDCCHLSIHA
jgi:hypothetical protein